MLPRQSKNLRAAMDVLERYLPAKKSSVEGLRDFLFRIHLAKDVCKDLYRFYVREINFYKSSIPFEHEYFIAEVFAYISPNDQSSTQYYLLFERCNVDNNPNLQPIPNGTGSMVLPPTSNSEHTPTLEPELIPHDGDNSGLAVNQVHPIPSDLNPATLSAQQNYPGHHVLPIENRSGCLSPMVPHAFLTPSPLRSSNSSRSSFLRPSTESTPSRSSSPMKTGADTQANTDLYSHINKKPRNKGDRHVARLDFLRPSHSMAEESGESPLSLVELAHAACEIHDLHPPYDVLTHNCYWFCDMAFNVLSKLKQVPVEGVDSDDSRYLNFLASGQGKWLKVFRVGEAHDDDINAALEKTQLWVDQLKAMLRGDDHRVREAVEREREAGELTRQAERETAERALQAERETAERALQAERETAERAERTLQERIQELEEELKRQKV